MCFFTSLYESLDAVVGVNQIGQSFANIALIVLGEVSEDLVGFFIEIDLPMHHMRSG